MFCPAKHGHQKAGLNEKAIHHHQENQVLLINEEVKADLSKDEVPMDDRKKQGEKLIYKNFFFAIPPKRMNVQTEGVEGAKMKKKNLSGVNVGIEVGFSGKAPKIQKQKETFSVWTFTGTELLPPQMEISLFFTLIVTLLVTTLLNLIFLNFQTDVGCRKDYEVARRGPCGLQVWDDKTNKEVAMWNFKSNDMCSKEEEQLLNVYKRQKFYPTVEEDYTNFESESGFTEDRIVRAEFDVQYNLRKNPNKTSSSILDDWIPSVRHIAVIDDEHLLKIEWTREFANNSCSYCVVLTSSDTKIFGHQTSKDTEIKIRVPHNEFYIAQIKVANGGTIFHSRAIIVNALPTNELGDRFFSAFSGYVVFTFNKRVIQVIYRNNKLLLVFNLLLFVLFLGVLMLITFTSIFKKFKKHLISLEKC